MLVVWLFLFMGPLSHLGFLWFCVSFVAVYLIGLVVIVRIRGWDCARHHGPGRTVRLYPTERE